MNCREVSQFLSEFVAGELPAEVVGEFDVHLAKCHTCVEFMAQYRATIAASRGAFEMPCDVPDELVEAIMKALKQAE